MMMISIISIATNMYLIKKLANKASERKDVVLARKQLHRNRKILFNQYLEIGTISERR